MKFYCIFFSGILLMPFYSYGKHYEYTGNCLYSDHYVFEACLDKELALYDAQLNKLYKEMTGDKRIRKAILERIKKNELLWIQFKEADCSFMASEVNEGLEYSFIYDACLINKTKARIADLKRSFFYSDWFKKD